jgi:hypothetical protein
MSRLPHILDILLTGGDEVVRLMHQLPYTLHEDLWYSFLLKAESTTGQLEGLGTLKKSNDLIGN